MPEMETLHSWDLSTAEARDLQLDLAARVDRSTADGLRRDRGGGRCFLRTAWQVALRGGRGVACGNVGGARSVRDHRRGQVPVRPGLLSFREAPPVIEAFKKLTVRPDVLICDGQGIAHPRRLGLASHIGLWLGLPTIGCAKSWLCGEYQEPGPDRGDWSPMTDAGETIGAVVRTRTRIKPLYVSTGHLCDLESAIAIVLATSTKYRQPWTTRLAHQYVNDLRRQGSPADEN